MLTPEEIVVIVVFILLIGALSYVYGRHSGKQEGKDELMKDLVYIWKNFPEFEKKPDCQSFMTFMKREDNYADVKGEAGCTAAGDESLRERL